MGRVKPSSSKTQAQHSCTLLKLQICSCCISPDLAHILRMLPAPPWPLFLSKREQEQQQAQDTVTGRGHCLPAAQGEQEQLSCSQPLLLFPHWGSLITTFFYSGIHLQQIQSKFSFLEMSLPNLANLSKGSKAI